MPPTRGNECASHAAQTLVGIRFLFIVSFSGGPFPGLCVLNNRMEMVSFIFFIILLHLEKKIAKVCLESWLLDLQ